MLERAQKEHPRAVWWLKMDGCDLVEGIGESVDQQWTGDVDLADGKLQEQHRCYLDRLRFVSHFDSAADNASLCKSQFLDDCSFITSSKN